MRTNLRHDIALNAAQRGISIIELIVFIVVVGLASGALFKNYIFSVQHNADPMIQVRALEAVQSKLDEILALKYDEATPTGGIPACGSSDLGADPCTNTPDANMNDVDDYHGFSDSPYTGYTRTVTVVAASNQKLVTVTVTGPLNVSISLAAYRANF